MKNGENLFKIIDQVKHVYQWFKAKNIRFIALLVTFLVLAIIIYIRSNKTTTSQTQTATVQKGTIVSSVSASGKVISSNITSVTTQASGIVKKVYVKEGDKISKGEKIAEIDLDLEGSQQNAQAYASYINSVNSLSSANNNLRSAQASLDVVYDEIKGHDTDETLAMKETRTKAEVAKDNAYNSVKGAQANLTSSSYNLRINSPTITAPSSGIITSLNIAEGMTLGGQINSSGTRSGQAIGSIVKEGKILISANVSEIDVPNVKIGQKATIIFDSIPDKTFSGQVVTIDRVGSTTSNVTTYPAIISLDNSSDQILPNMAATANIITQVKDNVLLIPSSAIQTQAGQLVVKAVKGKETQTVNVETGISSDSQIEILSGLSEGDVVITSTTTTSTGNNQTRSVFSTGGFGGARFIGR